MRVLYADRYLRSRHDAIDLATGAGVQLRRARRAREPLFARAGSRMLIDVIEESATRVEVWEGVPRRCGGGDPACTAITPLVTEAMLVAEPGVPRILALAQCSALTWSVVRFCARLARHDGWIPIALSQLSMHTAHGWPEWLASRSLVIFAARTPAAVPDRWPSADQLARHIRAGIIVCAEADAAEVRPPRSHARERWRVREPAVDGMLRDVDSRVLSEVRDSAGEVETRWASTIAELKAEDRRTREVRLATLIKTLAESDRPFEARALAARLDDVARHRAVAVGRREMGQRAVAHTRSAHLTGISRQARSTGMVDDFVGLLQLCQDSEDEHVALSRVGAFVRERLNAAGVAYIVREGRDLRVLARAGIEPPGLTTAEQSIDSGCLVTAQQDHGPAESASPVRYSAEVIGALLCRWSAGTPIAPRDAGMLLGVAAAASGPSLRAVVDRHRLSLATVSDLPELLGESAAMQDVRAVVLRAAASPFPVVIEGESGAGKELVARAIHAYGARRSRRFCAINCAALVDDLVEAELFGHVRGAFTGAAAERAGLFEEASGGTLFLDEVAELGGRVQAKLLRTLQEGEVRRLGESTVRRVDVRIVAATNRPLATEVAESRFRRDLWYRLDVLRIPVPPLRARIEDLPVLVRHLWGALAQRTGSRAVLSSAAVAALGAYDWPGNVRELQNVLASVLVSSPRRGVLGPAALPSHVARVAALGPAHTLNAARRQFEERFVRAALGRAGGRTTIAARELGLSRQGLVKALLRLGIEHPRLRPVA